MGDPKPFSENLSQEDLETRTQKLRQQFREPESVKFKRGEEIRIVDLKPEHEKTEVPVVFQPGWAGTPAMYEDNLVGFAERERRVVAIDAPHGIQNEMQTEERFADAELRKVAGVIAGMDAKGLERVDAIGHSQGAIDVVLAAYLHPDRFRNIVLINPGGVIGEDTPLRLMGRFIKDGLNTNLDALRRPEIKDSLKRTTREIVGAAFDSLSQSLEEMKALAHTPILDLLPKLRERGIKVAIVHGIDDATFPMDRVQKMVKMGMVDGFLSVKGRHGQFQLDPVPYTNAVDHLLDAMEKKAPL
jgi:pimeloyl-ACP methyl ester carboxylesterase